MLPVGEGRMAAMLDIRTTHCTVLLKACLVVLTVDHGGQAVATEHPRAAPAAEILKSERAGYLSPLVETACCMSSTTKQLFQRLQKTSAARNVSATYN